ncbi:MAG: bifunctional RNase H/acid phosphatase [Frankiales bacterium]|nr:bifunctional RNase H/acid phosphatase [Frankiales bacterium]
MRVVIEADGGSRGNPGPAGYGAVVMDADTLAVLAERKEYIGIETNNVAEYRGLIAGLEAAGELGASEVAVRMDSKLVVEQMSGRWQVKHPAMRPLARRAAELSGQFAQISYTWIERAKNKHADRLANEAMDAGMGRTSRPVAEPAVVRDADPTDTLVARQPKQQNPAPQAAWVPPDTTPTRLILLRHGVTDHSVARVFAGRSDLHLNTLGQGQARRAAQRAMTYGPVDVVISSPLQRTRQTADQVAALTGSRFEIEPDVVETDFGEWDGYSFAEVRERWPVELAAWMADETVAPPKGESFEAVTERVVAARDRILARYAGQTVVVVSHVTPIKVLVRLALLAPPQALHRMFLEPASISVIDYYGDGPVSLRAFNDAAHL